MMAMPPLSPITVLSLLHFCGAIGWSVVLLAAIAGYGSLLLRLCGLRRSSLTLAATAGFGVTLLLGGLLNLRHLIAGPVLFGFVGLGLLAGALGLAQAGRTAADGFLTTPDSPRTPRWVASALLVAFAVMFVIRLGASVHTPYYQISDDYNFYLASPVKMLERHFFAPDPFSERRIMSSLGGNNFLEVLVLAALPLEDVQMADRAIGLLLLALLAFRLARQFELSRTQTAALAALFVLMPQLQFNLTFVVLPSALFLGMVSIAADPEALGQRPWLQALLLGLAAGAIATMKSTYVVHGVLFFTVFAMYEARRRGITAGLRAVALGGLGCLLVMAPWMIASHAASATWFYPSLGQGYQYSRYGLYPPPGNYHMAIILKKVLPFNAPMVLLAVLFWRWGRRDPQTRAAITLATAAAIASILVGVATGGDSVRRYNYPAILPAILLTYAVFARRRNAVAETATDGRRWRLLAHASAALVVFVSIYVGLNTFTYEYAWYFRSLRASVTDLKIVRAPVQTEYDAINAALRPDGSTLESVGYPFLLNFRQHSILMADIPGAASLPSGWPAKQSGEALADYLLGHGIRYLLYAYNDGVVTSDAAAFYTMHDPHATQWIHSENEIQLDAHHQYEELAQTRRHLYDDGKIYLLDLQTPTVQPAW